MLHGRIGTIALGGLAAYLLINKAMNMVGHTVDKVCDASKWRSYYRNSKGGAYVVAPGYSSYTRPVGNDQEWVVEKNPDRKPAPKKDGSEPSLGAAIAEAVLKAINDKLKGTEAPEGASEGETEASEEEESDISEEDDGNNNQPHDYAAFMTYIHDCEEKGMSEKEIALSLGMDVSTLRRNISDAEDILRNQEKEPLYRDDIADGVQIVEAGDVDGDEIDIEVKGEANEDLD